VSSFVETIDIVSIVKKNCVQLKLKQFINRFDQNLILYFSYKIRSENMKLKQIISLFLFTILLTACSDEVNLRFKNIADAEMEIGEIKIPIMPNGFQVEKVTYKSDGFTHPITKVFYNKGDQKITFMIASAWYDNSPAEKVKSNKIKEVIWITKDKEYVLKWRKTNQEVYKYLFTKNMEDKDLLVRIAERY